MDTLKKHKLDENTLVVFMADQGLAGGHSGFWGMGDHTRPLTAYDWTMHVPRSFAAIVPVPTWRSYSFTNAHATEGSPPKNSFRRAFCTAQSTPSPSLSAR